MTDTNDKTEQVDKPAVVITENSATTMAAEGEGKSAESSKQKKDKAASARPKRKRSIPWFNLFLLLLVSVTIAAVAWLAMQGKAFIDDDSARFDKVETLEQQYQQQAQQLTAINQSLVQSLPAIKAENKKSAEQLRVLEQRVVAQNKRLLAMSTVSREDWLLAEAEYLLKLANQRILIEHSASGAEALLTKADAIMRDLSDPDLFPLRKAINSDLAALRLVQKIDVEGIYLAIDGLINHIESLPLQPTRQQVMVVDSSLVESKGDAVPEAASWWQKVKASFNGFIQGVGQYVRVRDHSVQPRALLSPDSARYLQQNIQLLLARSQVALMREQPAIYSQSLTQAASYIEKYLPASVAANNFRAQLKMLSEKNIVTVLPDISASLELLHSYIEDLHSLKGAKPAKPAVKGAKS